MHLLVAPRAVARVAPSRRMAHLERWAKSAFQLMALPRRITVTDIQKLATYFASKPTGATITEAKRVIDSRCFDPKKIEAVKALGFLSESDGKFKATERARLFARSVGNQREQILQDIVRSLPAYFAIIERAAHRGEESLSAVDVGALWHEHFKADVSTNDEIINEQVIAFFGIAQEAKLGAMVVGRRGAPTRFKFAGEACAAMAGTGPIASTEDSEPGAEAPTNPPPEETKESVKSAIAAPPANASGKTLGQGIFIAHGKNKKPLEQLKRILDQFRVPYKVAVEEANLGRPISAKVKDTMESCNCAILIFTADEEFTGKGGSTIWRPSENVIYELGASGYLYGNRMVILKEEDVTFPTNFRDLCYISFTKDNLDSKAMDIIKELIGFNILRVSV